MKRLFALLAIACLTLVTAGCSIHHDVQKDYPQYLRNNQGAAALPKAQVAATYSITPQTAQHHYEFRSVMTGYANVWMVDFGKMLDQTLQSADLQAAFGKLEKQTAGDGNAVVFELREYSFSDFGAHIQMAISSSRNGRPLLSKTYAADGKSQGGKMFLGGVFGMKNAIQQSTKTAVDDILRRFITDLNAATAETQPATASN